MSAKTTLPFVAVTWLDAWKSATTEVTVKEAEESHKPAVMYTVGWVVRDDDKGIQIANERCLDAGDEGYRGRSFIPRGMIQSVTLITLTRRRGRPSTTASSPSSASPASSPHPTSSSPASPTT